MNRSFVQMVVLALVGGALSYGVAGAQGNEPSTLEREVESLEAEEQALTGEERLERSIEKIDKMKETLERTTTLLEKVRVEEKDILKLNCVNGKLAPIKGFLKLSEQSYSDLKTAVQTDDQEAQNHHYTLITIAGRKVAVLGEGARVCAGAVLRFAGDTEVETTVDPDIAMVEFIEQDDYDYDYSTATERLPELTVYQ